MLQLNLIRFLFPDTDPQFWICPIQEGLPYLITRVNTLLAWVAALVFLAGIIMATFYYLTAYGDENRAKQGKETFKWTLIGSIVIMLAWVVIQIFVRFLAASDQPKTFDQVDNRCGATEQSAPDLRNPNAPQQAAP